MDEFLRTGFLAHSMLPVYRRHIAQARQSIQNTLKACKRPYIAFSTGKDSTVMADLIWRESPDIPAVYFDADACFPESIEMMNRYREHGRTIIIWLTEPLLDTMARVGGPTSPQSEAATMRSTVYRPIQSLMVEHKFDCACVGLRAGEGVVRKMAIRANGNFFYSKRDGIYVSWPIAPLTFRDVWAYICSNDVDYCAVYDRQFEMGLDWEDCRLSYCYGETKHAEGRWTVLARGWPDIFNKFAQRFPEVRRYI